MFEPVLEDGKVFIPKRAEGGSAIGDGWVELKKGDENYDAILAWLIQKQLLASQGAVKL